MTDWVDVNDSLPDETGDWLEIKVDGEIVGHQFKWWDGTYGGGNFVNILFEPEKRHVTHWRKATNS